MAPARGREAAVWCQCNSLVLCVEGLKLYDCVRVVHFYLKHKMLGKWALL